MPTDETKNNFIEKTLAQLLRQLKEAAWRRYGFQGDMEILNGAIKAFDLRNL
ncbi:MAG: hypothetical protein O7C59_09630 [Rickettsia endosymbiont of Ixodes persulcatus]|nr:hypothetical protein [Rickettsia endosymbiont of Ixodes persulcatus]